MKTRIIQVPNDKGILKPLLEYVDTAKNLAYVEKRRKLGERATAELGVSCFG